jgi:catechol 2,3-dioxygenase-like lactoylglutathione lyase family enzyme
LKGPGVLDRKGIVVKTSRTFGSFSVNDIEAAKSFYGDTLGLHVTAAGQQGSIWVQGPDGHDTLVYPTGEHVAARFTVLNLAVDNIEDAVDELTAHGVRFERYEGLEADDRGIFHAPGHSVAWFTDPSGNVLSLVHEE